MANRYAEKKYYNCLHCKKEKRWNNQSTNKYCDHICQWNYRYENIRLPLLLEGKLTTKKDSAVIKKFLTERDGYKCSICNLTNWLGEEMILDIDHIDGDNDNNHPSNWRFLCPNCHRMTPTWGNKKRI